MFNIFQPTTEEEKKQADAIEWVKRNRRELIDYFCPLSKFPKLKNPNMVFMAGSPGAGKTEYSTNLVKIMALREPPIITTRLDTDEVREKIPGYDGSNSYLYQGAAALGMEKLIQHVFDHNQNAIIDTTLSDRNIAFSNIQRALGKKHNYSVSIIYLYQNPRRAWRYTKLREVVEKRYVPLDVFLQAYSQVPIILKEIKEYFDKDVSIDIIIKNYPFHPLKLEALR